MPNNDIGWNCEEVVIQILGSNPAMLALNPTHAESDKESDTVAIVVKAERVTTESANQLVPGATVRRVSMRVMIRTSLGQIDATKLYGDYGAMCGLLESMDGAVYASIPALQAFSFLVQTPALENEREKDENRRKMMKTFDFLAILQAAPILP